MDIFQTSQVNGDATLHICTVCVGRMSATAYSKIQRGRPLFPVFDELLAQYSYRL